MQNSSYRGNILIAYATGLLTWAAIFLQLYFVSIKPIGLQTTIFLFLFSVTTGVILILKRRFTHYLSLRFSYLLSTFTLITAWRLASLAGIPCVPYLYLLAFICKFINFIVIAHNDITCCDKQEHDDKCFEWQLMFIRLFVGFDLIPHFSEKLFAGPVIRVDDLNAFIHLGVPSPLAMVLIAGLMEFGGALSLSCGFFTRLGSICLFIYLIVATTLGHHFSLGFIWASAGGGWEFPVFWSTLVLSFAVFGANRFSFDGYLKERFNLPKWVRFLMG